MRREGAYCQGDNHHREAKKNPLCHCCQRGRKLIRNKNKNISKKRLPSMPKGENVGHKGMILSLMSKG
jgi:hypothetical protein